MGIQCYWRKHRESNAVGGSTGNPMLGGSTGNPMLGGSTGNPMLG
jgi:hypothetical protein